MADKRTIYLLNEKHSGHPMRFIMTPKESSSKLANTDDGMGIIIPEGSELKSLVCLTCEAELKEGVDYQFGRPKAEIGYGGDHKEPWRIAHAELYDTFGDGKEGWMSKHRELYPESSNTDWLQQHRELYGG